MNADQISYEYTLDFSFLRDFHNIKSEEKMLAKR